MNCHNFIGFEKEDKRNDLNYLESHLEQCWVVDVNERNLVK